MNADSIDKIVRCYFACVNDAPFEYKGDVFAPKDLRVSPDIFRGYTCPAGCGGCCPKFTLDYLPTELRTEGAATSSHEARQVKFNGRSVTIISDLQAQNSTSRCRNLLLNGRCAIHGHQPFSCDFEITRFLTFSDKQHPNALTTKLFGRGWNMLRVDGQRGALCEMLPATLHTRDEVVRKLKRLSEWMRHFGLTTKRLEKIIAWCSTGPHSTAFLCEALEREFELKG